MSHDTLLGENTTGMYEVTGLEEHDRSINSHGTNSRSNSEFDRFQYKRLSIEMYLTEI